MTTVAFRPVRLPVSMRISVVSEAHGSQWTAATTIYNLQDIGAGPQQPLPSVLARSRAQAEAAALEEFRSWANRNWPRRTLPDPT